MHHKVLLWRHAEDTSEKRLRYDTELRDDQECIIIDLVKTESIYHSPEVIWTSPYRRCRKTAKIMAKTLNIPVMIDVRLSRYMKAGHIHKSTAKFEPMTWSSRKCFAEDQRQVLKHRKNCWFVTHAYNIKTIAKIAGYKTEDYLDFLHKFYV